jgi:hypothetical protein
MSILQRIKQKVLEDNYAFSSHAIEEMENDEIMLFEREDVRKCLLTGTIRKREVASNGTKYVICGKTIDGYFLEAVVMFRNDGKLFILTNYILD